MSADEREPSGSDWSEWREVWQTDRALPIESGRGVFGWLIVLFKKLFRPFVKTPQNDLWERQRAFNLALVALEERVAEQTARNEPLSGRLDRLEGPVHQELAARLESIASDLRQVQGELSRDFKQLEKVQEDGFEAVQTDMAQLRDKHLEYLQSQADRLVILEGFKNDGLDDINRHADALFARVDQKMTRYRRESRELWSRMEALLAVAENADPGAAAPLVRASKEQGYVELERLFRGSQSEIRRRLRPYLGYLENRAPVLDIGCGRGESLEILRDRGIAGRGVDSSADMVAQCRDKGLEAEQGDLFEVLVATDPGSLGAVISFHVIEHLPADSLGRLVRLAWRALRPGGVLVLETPSPLSVVVAARNFWLDPTHLRPVHPASLKLTFELSGFEPVVQLDLQPFAEDDRLPEIVVDDLADELKPVADGINRLRDRLDELLFGYQDFGMVGFKPGPEPAAR
jgi:O-antigen chain-terminating methyltransferase